FNSESATAGIYKDEHLKILTALADHAGLALGVIQQAKTQSQRYQRLTDFNEELFLRNEISHFSTTDQPLEEMLPKMAERLARLVEADACALTLWDSTGRRTRRLAAYGLDLGDFLSERFRPAGAPSLTSDIVQAPKVHIINDAQKLANPPSAFIQ